MMRGWGAKVVLGGVVGILILSADALACKCEALSLEVLDRGADLVLVGEAVSGFLENQKTDKKISGSLATPLRFRVRRVFKGSHPEKEVVIQRALDVPAFCQSFVVDQKLSYLVFVRKKDSGYQLVSDCYSNSHQVEKDSIWIGGKLVPLDQVMARLEKARSPAQSVPGDWAPLLAAPSKYHGKVVTLEGYYRTEFEMSGLYSSRDSLLARDPKQCVWIEFEPGFRRQAGQESLHQKRLVVRGVLNVSRKGHLGSCIPGSLEKAAVLKQVQGPAEAESRLDAGWGSASQGWRIGIRSSIPPQVYQHHATFIYGVWVQNKSAGCRSLGYFTPTLLGNNPQVRDEKGNAMPLTELEADFPVRKNKRTLCQNEIYELGAVRLRLSIDQTRSSGWVQSDPVLFAKPGKYSLKQRVIFEHEGKSLPLASGELQFELGK